MTPETKSRGLDSHFDNIFLKNRILITYMDIMTHPRLSLGSKKICNLKVEGSNK